MSARCNLIAQVFVHGDSLESSLVAIVIPEPETFVPFATAITGGSSKDVAVLCKDPRVIAAFLNELEKAGRAGGLRGFEIVKRIQLSTDMFSIENGLLTPTLKVRRPQVKDYFLDQIKVMYDDLRASTPVAKL